MYNIHIYAYIYIHIYVHIHNDILYKYIMQYQGISLHYHEIFSFTFDIKFY